MAEAPGVVDDCFDCSSTPNIGMTQCSMDEGILEAIIEEKLKVQCSIRDPRKRFCASR